MCLYMTDYTTTKQPLTKTKRKEKQRMSGREAAQN